MVFGWIANYLANQAKVVDKLADSYPIRRAAQLVIYLLIKKPNPAAQKFIKGDAFQSPFRRMKERLKKQLEK